MTEAEVKTRKGVPIWALALIVIAAAGITFFITAMVANLGEKKGESATQYTQVVQINETNQNDPSVWGQNFPQEYDGWLATSTYKSSDHKPDALIPHTSDDPRDTRTAIAASKIEDDPRLVTMWKGFAFAIDYRHARGHMYMLDDQKTTLRVLERPQPGACVNCHASLVAVYTEYSKAGANATFEETMQSGFEQLNNIPYNCNMTTAKDDCETAAAAMGTGDPSGVIGDMATKVTQPLGCVDCHDPATMELRVSRPALLNSYAAYKEGKGVTGYQVNRDATTQEMRALVCAQCHIEYYFEPVNKNVIFPWAKGLDIDDTYAYYSEIGFSDFKHAITDQGMLKVQHPEYEAWSSSVHAANGVTCADCHMSYQRVGSQKISNHDVQNPLNDINGTCGKCHTASEQVLQDRVTTINNRFKLSRDKALDSLVTLIGNIEDARAAAGLQAGDDPTPDIKAAMELQRMASYYIDYAYSENSYGFHNPDYFQRIINQSLDASRQGQLILAGVAKEDLAPSQIAQKNTEHIEETGLK